MNNFNLMKVRANYFRSMIWERWHQSKTVKSATSLEAANYTDQLNEILSKYSNEESIFLNVGLADIKAVFNCDPYQFVLKKFMDRFKNILAPGYTPSFRKSGIYHKKYSLPEYGLFSRLFLEVANYRTNDAIHSILVLGDYNFSSCNHNDSFSDESCFAQLDHDNMLHCNIGTKWFTSTLLHYIDRHLEAPYVDTVRHNGICYFDDVNHAEVTQVNYKSKYHWRWNRSKLKKDLITEKVVDYNDIGGLNLFFYKAGDLKEFISRKSKIDPYYLVT